MQFTTRKRRQPPPIIIISLIDILIVLLIFLMVTTTFKQRPAVKLTLPESKQAKAGAADEDLVVTVGSEEPIFYFKTMPVTLERLQESLQEEAKSHPGIRLTINGDESSSWGNIFKVMDAAKAAGISVVQANAKLPGQK